MIIDFFFYLWVFKTNHSQWQKWEFVSGKTRRGCCFFSFSHLKTFFYVFLFALLYNVYVYSYFYVDKSNLCFFPVLHRLYSTSHSVSLHQKSCSQTHVPSFHITARCQVLSLPASGEAESSSAVTAQREVRQTMWLWGIRTD